MPVFDARFLEEFATRLLEAAGVPADEARVVGESLIGSNLRGHDSHGLMRVIQYVGFLENGEYHAGVDLLVEGETPAIVRCDAQWGFGQVQAHRLLDRIIPRAETLGMAAGTARRCGHIGRLGEYAERAARSGLVLIATVNNDGAAQRVAPPGGVAPRLGTNPLCVGVPQEGEPVVLDFSTSAVAEGKVRVHYLSGKAPVPEGWLLDSSGNETTDPSVLYEPPLGSIVPMGGSQAYKGFGLSLVLDMLSGGLSGGHACYPGAGPARGNNVLFVVLNPALFAGDEHFLNETGGLTAYVRDTPRRAGVEAILIPGEPERAVFERRSAEGIPIPDGHWAKLLEVADRLGVAGMSGSSP